MFTKDFYGYVLIWLTAMSISEEKPLQQSKNPELIADQANAQEKSLSSYEADLASGQ